MQATRKPEKKTEGDSHLKQGLREGALFVSGAIALYVLISLLSYDPGDPGWSFSGSLDRVQNVGGLAGAWLSSALLRTALLRLSRLSVPVADRLRRVDRLP